MWLFITNLTVSHLGPTDVKFQFYHKSKFCPSILKNVMNELLWTDLVCHIGSLRLMLCLGLELKTS